MRYYVEKGQFAELTCDLTEEEGQKFYKQIIRSYGNNKHLIISQNQSSDQALVIFFCKDKSTDGYEKWKHDTSYGRCDTNVAIWENLESIAKVVDEFPCVTPITIFPESAIPLDSDFFSDLMGKIVVYNKEKHIDKDNATDRSIEYCIQWAKQIQESRPNGTPLAGAAQLPPQPPPATVKLVNEDSLADKFGESVAKRLATGKASAKTLTVPRVKIDYEKVVANLYEARPETILFSSERLLALLKGLPGGENVTITESRIRHLKVWTKYRAVRMSGKVQFWENLDDVDTEGNFAPKEK